VTQQQQQQQQEQQQQFSLSISFDPRPKPVVTPKRGKGASEESFFYDNDDGDDLATQEDRGFRSSLFYCL